MMKAATSFWLIGVVLILCLAQWAAGVGVAMADVTAIQDILRQQQPLQTDALGRGGKLIQAIEAHEKKKPATWQEDVKAVQGLPAKELLERVQDLVNERIHYQEDPANKWLPPSLSYSGGGDCEDYAIAKLLLLREAGFPEESLRIVTLAPVRLTSPYHVILLAQLDNRVYALDSPGRSQSKDIVLLEDYRDGDRPVMWAGWSGGYSFSSSTLSNQPAGRYHGLLFPRRSRLARLVDPKDRLILVAADLKVITRRERALNQAEIAKLRNLRLYYNDPSPENARRLTAYEASKLRAYRKMRR